MDPPGSAFVVVTRPLMSQTTNAGLHLRRSLSAWDRARLCHAARMDVRRQVLQAAEARASALADADADALTELLHPQFRWTTHLGETYDRAEYIRRNTEGHTVWRSQELDDATVVVVDDAAVLFAEVADVSEGHSGATETFRMPVTQTWVRMEGGWRCLAGHAGPRRR
jgi:hypothetical protein